MAELWYTFKTFTGHNTSLLGSELWQCKYLGVTTFVTCFISLSLIFSRIRDALHSAVLRSVKAQFSCYWSASHSLDCDISAECKVCVVRSCLICTLHQDDNIKVDRPLKFVVRVWTGDEFIDQLSDCQLPEKAGALWMQVVLRWMQSIPVTACPSWCHSLFFTVTTELSQGSSASKVSDYGLGSIPGRGKGSFL
jgi:hypothetical protein